MEKCTHSISVGAKELLLTEDSYFSEMAFEVSDERMEHVGHFAI